MGRGGQLEMLWHFRSQRRFCFKNLGLAETVILNMLVLHTGTAVYGGATGRNCKKLRWAMFSSF